MTNVRHDFAGRYLLPDPVTGEERAWTRATTFAETLADRYGLEAWGKRMVAKGIATRDDLRALAAATPLTEKKALNRVAQQALDAVAAKAGANVGTALHEWTAQVDKGTLTTEAPYPWNRDIGSYVRTLKQHGITTHPGLVERIVCLPDLGVAGTFDRIVEWSGEMWIADVKTAADLSYSWGSIAIQLALYARAPYAWDEKREAWGPNQPVNWVEGIVTHLPAGQARCDLYWLNLDRGWEAAQLAAQVRDWRKAENLAAPFGVKMLGRSPLQAVPDLAGEGTQLPSPRGLDVRTPAPAKNSPAEGDGEIAAGEVQPVQAPSTQPDAVPTGEWPDDVHGPVGPTPVSLFEEGDPAYD